MRARVKYPDWVEAQRRPGTNISHIDGKYYLYGCHSEWNKQKDRAEKKNGGYLGRITKDGFIPKGTGNQEARKPHRQ